jgi:protein-S-isoprenylcysteine O-methyltransferase Ste14
MRATQFEFRHRFWLICLVYFLAFGCFAFDRLNAVVALALWILRESHPGLIMTSPSGRHVLHALFAVSAVLLTAAAWIRTWAGAYLRTEVVHDVALHTERVVADGPYRHLRNPLYFGDLLLAGSFAMMASRTGALVLVLGNLLMMLRLIGREEAALAQSQGKAYAAYVAAVPRLWPSLRSRLPSGGLQPGWLQAFLGEGHVWIFALDGFLYAWLLDRHLWVTLLWSCAGSYLLIRNVLLDLWRRKSPAPASHLPSPPAA